MTPLSSSNLQGYDYNPGTRFLVIYFHGNRPYTYKQVPQDIVDGLAAANSAGKYFNANIRNVFETSRGIQIDQGYEEHT